MPIPAFIGLPATLGTSADGLSTTWTLVFRYTSFCTNFVHDGHSSTFTGKARLQGDAVNVGLDLVHSILTTVTIGQAPDLTMTVATALFTTTGTITAPYFQLAFSSVAQPYSTYSPNYTTLDGSFAAQTISFVGSDSVEGIVYGEINGNSGGGGVELGSGNVFVSLSRGGSCPV